MTRRSLLSLLTLTLALGLGAPPAGAVNPKNQVSPESVALGAGGGVNSEFVAVPDKYAMKPDRFALHLTLEEHRSNGQIVFLGEQTVLLMNTVLVTENGPDGRDVFDVSWVTALVEANSDVLACAEIIDTMNENIRGEFLCRNLTPAF